MTVPPVIALPKDRTLIKRLRAKLEEYKQRLDPYRAPELQSDTLHKIAVLEHLLENGWVDTYKFSRELAAGIFNGRDLDNAYNVVADYCATGGKNIFGGTGLPKTA